MGTFRSAQGLGVRRRHAPRCCKKSVLLFGLGHEWVAAAELVLPDRKRLVVELKSLGKLALCRVDIRDAAHILFYLILATPNSLLSDPARTHARTLTQTQTHTLARAHTHLLATRAHLLELNGGCAQVVRTIYVELDIEATVVVVQGIGKLAGDAVGDGATVECSRHLCPSCLGFGLPAIGLADAVCTYIVMAYMIKAYIVTATSACRR